MIFKTLPSAILTTLCANAFRAASWVTIIMVIFSFTFRSTRIFITISVDLVSRSPVGSSRRRIFGLFAIDLAMVTRYYSPPESWFGKWSIRPFRSTDSNNLWARLRISSRESLPWSCIGNSTFSSAVRLPIRLKVWNTKPRQFSLMLARRLSLVEDLILSPEMYTSPFDGLSIVPIIFNSVVLPPPEVPRIVMNSPWLIVRFTPRRAGTPSMPRR